MLNTKSCKRKIEIFIFFIEEFLSETIERNQNRHQFT